MKSAKLLLLALGLALFTHCSKDSSNDPIDPKPDDHSQEEPQPEEETETIYFTFTEGEDKDTSASDNWVIINRPDGSFLDYKSFESGQTLEFKAKESEVPEIFTVSILNSSEGNLYSAIDVGFACVGALNNGISYPSIHKGSVWRDQTYPSHLENTELLNRNGNFNLIFTSPYNLAIANGHPMFPIDQLFGTISFPRYESLIYPSKSTHVYSSDPFFEELMIREMDGIHNFTNSPYLYSILDFNGNLKYKLFNGPSSGADVELDYRTDFLAYDQYGYLPKLPETYTDYAIELVGFETEKSFQSDTGYFILDLYNRPYEGKIPLGYLERFPFYKTFVQIEYPKAEYHYTLLGGKTNITAYPNIPTFQISGNSIQSFEVDTDTPYVRRKDLWGKGVVTADECYNTSWTMMSTPDFSPYGLELPDALLEKVSNLSVMDQLSRKYSTIYLRANQNDYQEFIANTFDPNYDHIIKPGMEEEYFKITQ